MNKQTTSNCWSNVWKRFMSLFLALAMLLTLFPSFALSANAAAGDTLYLVPSSTWKTDGARFAAYFFGAGDTWASMTDSDGDGYYECTIPSGGYTSVIFCRMNPSNTTNSWDNKWNQTADLTLPTDGKNCMTLTEGWWDSDTGSWSTYTPVVEEPETTAPSEAPDATQCDVTLHFADSKGWGSVSFYSWYGENTLSSAWPGDKTGMDADGFYTVSFTVDVVSGENLNFIFNNGGNGSQTVDLSIAASEVASGSVEKWVQPTDEYVDDDSSTTKYYASIVESADAVVTSPVVDGTSVTFEYLSTSASSVVVYGSWNSWASSTALTKNQYGVWSATLTDLEPGTYEYKFVVDSAWITDPSNTWISNGNSAFLVLDPNAVDTNEITVNFHYSRSDGNYTGWNLWVWTLSGIADQYDFENVNGEMVTSLTVDGRDTQYVSFIPRMSTEENKWASQEYGERRVDLSSLVSGTVDVYITSGTYETSNVLNTDVVQENKITSVELDYDNDKVIITTTKLVSFADPMDAFDIVDITNASSDIAISSIEANGNTYTLTLNKEMDLVNLYRYKIRFLDQAAFTDYNYNIDINTVYASEKFGNEFTYDGTLGAIWSSASTSFRLWAPTAAKVVLNLYASGTDGTDDCLGTYEMTQDVNGTWIKTVSGDLNGVYYTYSVTRDGETIEAVDPYARTTGVNGLRGMVIDLDSTDPADWENDVDPNPLASYTDAIIYELHVRDFSIDDSSGVKEAWQGKFLALTQTGTTSTDGVTVTGLDYLKSMGFTHLHLLPVYDYASVDETTCDTFNWGYDPLNYNVPEGSYSTDPYNGEVRVTEFKEMVSTLHDNGISVIMDVVYNHVYDAGAFSMNMIVPGYFSRVNSDGSFSNGSGCGNDTASEREMVRKFIVESVNYWADEYHVDGFRFDLVGLLDATTINMIVDTVHENHPGALFYGEGWTMGTAVEEGNTMATQANSSATPEFAYFSDTIRNLLGGQNGTSLGFVSGSTGREQDVADNFMARPWWTSNPTQIIQYASCHDNYTLVDKLILSTGKSGIDAEIIKMNNLAAAVYMTAQGIPFIHAGEEFLREKLEEDGGRCENSYNASDYVNHIEWSNLEDATYAANSEYYKGLIAFRKNHAALRLPTTALVTSNVSYTWVTNEVVKFQINGGVNGEIADSIVVIFNASKNTQSVSLPSGTWSVCIDATNAGVEELYTASGSVSVPAISAMVLVQGELAMSCEHNYVGVVTAPTCTTGGYTTYTCSECGDTYTGSETAATGHSYGDWTTTKEASCTETGTKTRSCGNCGNTETASIAATGHSYTSSVTAPTCTEGGYTTYTCSVCGDNYTGDETIATGHSYSNGSCTVCGAEDPDNQESTLSATYYLIGYINGANYGCEGDYANMGEYKFDENGKLTATFTETSYVFLKTEGNANWYMAKTYVSTNSGTFYNTSTGTSEKMMVPAGVEVTFTLVENSDGSLTLSYTTSSTGGETGSAGDYYLFGYIDGLSYGEGDQNYANLGSYKFVDGKVTATFKADSYVGVKTGDLSHWYMTDGWLGSVKSATLYDTGVYDLGTTADKLMVPGGVEVTFTLTVNSDSTVTLSYEADTLQIEDESGIQDGVTLHVWNWSFANIEANMAKIAEQGYTAIQTSPIQAMKEATTGKPSGTNWWVFYQPVDFVITTDSGNALGTKDEFISMVETAHKYGIKVIVDVVANHLANQSGNDLSTVIPSYLRDNAAYWHDYTVNTSDYTDREDITQHCMSGLPDLNTGNDDIQGYVLDFLKECIDAGADGFRFDAAKHIETPEDDASFASDFWPTVINGAEEYAKTTRGIDLYCYGELLDAPGGTLPISAYTKYLAATDNSWGNTLRGNINGGIAAISEGYNKAVDAAQLILWAESHDTYANEDQNSDEVSDANINKTWALVAARADAMGLYFARPESLTETLLGEADLTAWANSEVKAANKFHNAFAGQGEVIGNSGNIAYVVRGTTGVVLVNAAGTNTTVNVPALGMVDGTYTDQITGNTFTVANGTITGSIGSTGIAVVYNAAAEHEHSYTAVVTDPTCTEGGYTTYTCSCGDSYTADETAATGHSYGDWNTSKEATCTEAGSKTRTCGSCGNTESESIAASGHSYVDGTCSVCGAEDPDYVEPTVEYYLVGNINGANYGCEEDYATLGEYKFVDGQLVATFTTDSYVFLKTGDNANWYMTQEYVTTNSGTFYLTSTGTSEKMYVPGNVELTFTLVENADGSLTLSYAAAAVEPELFDISFASMTMGNSLAMNFAFEQGHVSDWTGHYAQITKVYGDGREDAVVTVPYAEWKSTTISSVAHYYVTFSNIAAKEMTDNVYVTIYNANGEAVSTTWIDSVQSQAMRNLAKSTITDLEKTMVVDMLNYGAGAQEYFSYNTDNLATGLLSDEQKACATATTTYEDTHTGNENYFASNLVLKSNIQLVFGFRNVTTDMHAVITYTNHWGNAKTITVDGADFAVNGSIYVVTVENMVVADCRQDITCTIYDGDTVVATATDSVESYVARKSADGEMFELLMKFSDSAYAFFHK